MSNHPTYTFFFLVIVLSLGLPLIAHGQTDAELMGNCTDPLGEGELNAGNVRARILNNGSLFYRGSPFVYEVPKGGGKHAIFNTTMWVAGFVDKELRAAAALYGWWEFWPGPIDEEGRPPADCSVYDHLWEVRRDDIQAYKNTGVAPLALMEWPWHLGAPVVDGDGNPDNYNLEGGDLPELLGDQTIWWVMNDRGNVHRRTDSVPIGLEVHGTAFAFEHPGYISNQTFYRFKLINKNRRPFEDAYFGLFMDADLGDFGDDYRASDSLLHLAYQYNSDNFDDDPSLGYGENPPAVGFTFLKGALAEGDAYDNDRDGEIDEPGERIGMNSAHFWIDGGGVYRSPVTPEHFYNYMQARWKDSTRLTFGGYGHPISSNEVRTPTNFSYSGDPVTGAYWSEFNVDNEGTANYIGDRQVSAASGPFTLQPGESQDIHVAFVWSRGSSNLDSVVKLKQEVASIHEVSDLLFEPTRIDADLSSAQPVREVLGFDQNFPNPFDGSTTLRYSLPKVMTVRLAVYDVLGREVALLVDEVQETGIYEVDFNAGLLPGGVYIARIELDHLRFSKRMVRVR